MPERIKQPDAFKNKILTGIAAGVMGAYPMAGDIPPQHTAAKRAEIPFKKADEAVRPETKEDKELKIVATYVLEAKKHIRDLHAKNMHDQAREWFSQAVDHLAQSYLVSAKKYSPRVRVAVSRAIYDLYFFEGGYCSSHDEMHTLYEGGMTVSPRLALDSATLYHKDGEESERMRVLLKGYELVHTDPDWHTKFDIGEEYALALGMNGKVEDARTVYQSLFDAYQGLIARNMIAVDIHVQTIVDDGDFKKVEPYANEEAFIEYCRYRRESFSQDKK